MSKRKIFFLFLLLLGVGAIVFRGDLQRSFLSLLVVSELLNFENQGWLGKWSAVPKMKEISYLGPKGTVKADLFLPQEKGKHPGILLNHGVIDTGKDDPRLRRFAEILCRSGFVVFVPDFTGMRSFRIAPSDIDEVQAAFEYLISLEDYILPQSSGLFGFSYGAGPTILAACRPVMRDKVRFLMAFGAYYDLKNVLSFMATGKFEFEGKNILGSPKNMASGSFWPITLIWLFRRKIGRFFKVFFGSNCETRKSLSIISYLCWERKERTFWRCCLMPTPVRRQI